MGGEVRLSPTDSGREGSEAVRLPHEKENRNHTPSRRKFSMRQPRVQAVC